MLSTQSALTKHVTQSWPWQVAHSCFSPRRDLLEGDWLQGGWSRCRKRRAGQGDPEVVVTRFWNPQGQIERVVLDFGLDEKDRLLTFRYDNQNRLIELHDSSELRSQRLLYNYSEGSLARETHLIMDGAGPVSRTMARHLIDSERRPAKTEIRNDDGELREERWFNRRGVCTEIRLYNRNGQIVQHEVTACFPDGRPRRKELTYYDYSQCLPLRTLRRSTIEDFVYDGAGQLIQRMLTDRKNHGHCNEEVHWQTQAEEIVSYHPDRPGVPLRDETKFLEPGRDGEVVARYGILAEYQHDDQGRLQSHCVIEEDRNSGWAARRETRIVRCVSGTRPEFLGHRVPLEELKGLERLIVHEYKENGELSRLLQFQADPPRLVMSMEFE